MTTTIKVVRGTTFTSTIAHSNVRTGDNKSQRHDEIQTLARQCTRLTGKQYTPVFDGDIVRMRIDDQNHGSMHEDNMVKALRETVHANLRKNVA